MSLVVVRRIARRSLAAAGACALAACSLMSLDGLSSGHSDAGASSAPGADDAGADVTVPSPTDAASSSGESAPPSDDASGGTQRCADGGGIVCNGACVDPASDPRNCNGCGNVCASGRCGTSIVASMTTAPASWALNGSAFYSASTPSVELTPIGNGLVGSLVYLDPVAVDAFDAQFEFRMGVGGGSRSDGMGFVIEQTGPTALGRAGGGLGMAGLTGYGVELDIWDNGVCGDVSADQVGVDDLTLCSSTQGCPTSLASRDVTATVDVADRLWHTAHVALAQGALTVSIDGHAIVSGQALPNLQTGAPYYFAFTAGTGGAAGPDGGPGGYRQEVKSIAITFPTPRCL